MRTKVMNKEKDIDWDFLGLSVSKNKLKAFEPLLFKFLGDIFLHVDDVHVSEAEHWYGKAIETGEKDSLRHDVGKAYASYSELFRREGALSKAREHLGKAIDIMKQCGGDGWVKKYEEELAGLS